MAEHVWDIKKPKLKLGDSIRIKDDVPVDVRIAINEAARLGPAHKLEAKAALFKQLAARAEADHAARVVLDANPELAPELPHPSRPWLNFALLSVGLVTLVLVVAQYTRTPHPAPLVERSSVTLERPEGSKRVASIKKGRAAP